MIYYNDEIEKSIIGFIFNYQNLQDEIFTIPSYWFYRSKLKELYEKLQEIFYDGRPVDMASVSKEVSVSLVAQCAENWTGQTLFAKYRDELRELYNRRVIAGLLKKMPDEVNTSAAMVDYINHNISDLICEDENSLYSLDDLIEKYHNEPAYKEMITTVLTTGLIDLDEKIIVKNGDLVIIAGRPGMGKTALSLFISKSMAKSGKPVGFFSLEMRAQYLLKRLAHGEAPKFPGWFGYDLGCQNLEGLPLYIDDASKYNLGALRSKINTMIKQHNIQAAFIDYLTLIEMLEKETRSAEVGNTTRELKKMAKDFNIPIILLSQLSRKVEDRKDKKPVLSDLRDSGEIEQDADCVLFTYIPHKYGITKDAAGKDTERYMGVLVEKQRDGSTGTVPIYYNREKQHFGNWEKREMPEPVYNV